MKITFIRSNTNAVGEYRVHHPMLALRDMGHQCQMITLDKTPQKVGNNEVAGDILVLQRQVSTTVFELLETLPAPLRPKVIYEIDDNPWEWHSWDSIHAELGYEYGKEVKRCMKLCDAFTCSTPTLARRLRRELPGYPIWVIPNAIDYTIRNWTRKEAKKEHGLDDKIVLGWTGSIHHTRDGQCMLPAIAAVLAKYPEAVFLMQCDRSVYYDWTRPLKGVCDKQLRWVPPLPFDVHPMIYSLFNVNLAPLEVTPFNICKSDLRLIEGGAHGVPYVASKIASYLEFHNWSGGIGGHLAATAQEWYDGIVKLIDTEREARGQNLARYVKEKRALNVIAGQWETAFKSVTEGEQGEAIVGTCRPRRNDPCPCRSADKYKACCIPAYGR